MYYELYLDVFFLENFMMDFLLLLLIKRMLRCTATPGRICFGAAVGSGLTCIIVMIPIPCVFIKFILFHMFVNTCMIRAGLKIKNKTEFAKAFFLLYVGAFLLGGLLQAVQSYLRVGSLFFAIAIGGYYVVSGIWDCISRLQRVTEFRCQVDLFLEENMFSVEGIVDTGNNLFDPVTGEPVHILDCETAKRLISNLSERKIRYIPYHSIGKKEGVLAVLRIERMRIRGKQERWMEKPIIGISEEIVSADGKYKMILNPNSF